MALPERVKQIIHDLQPQLIETVCRSVQIPSVEAQAQAGAPYGKAVADALEHALETGRKLGFAADSIDGQVGWCEYGDGEENIVVLGHMDVVPAGSGWTKEPFDAEVSEGRIWGRGTMDDKGPMFACLYGLKALQMAGVPLKRKVRILFGTNEETGSADIPYYAAREPQPAAAFSPDGEFPVIFAEKGILNARLSGELGSDGAYVLESLDGGTASNVVPALCTGSIRVADTTAAAKEIEAICRRHDFSCRLETKDREHLELTLIGKSAHGSTPAEGVNAAARYLIVLNDLNMGGVIQKLAAGLGEEVDGSSLGIAQKDDIGSLTVNMGVLHGENGKLSLVLNIRYPVTAEAESVTAPLQAWAAANGMNCEIMSVTHPLYHAPDEPLIKRLLSVYREYRGEGEPIAIGGGTYAKELPNTVAFGPLFPGRVDLNHQADEYIALEELEELTQIYAQAIEELANMPAQTETDKREEDR